MPNKSLWCSIEKALLLVSLMGLAACGGGGGGGGGSSGGSSGATSSSSPIIADYAPGGSLALYSGSTGGYGYADGTGSSARFSGLRGAAMDASGNLYVADEAAHVVRMVTPAGVSSTLAGQPLQPGHVDGLASSALFKNLSGIALSSTGIVYVADSSDHTIRKISSGVVSTLAGSAGIAGSAEGSGTSARFNKPQHLAVDSFGNVFVADTNNHVIRKITSGGVVSTLAGSAGFSGSTNGSGISARFDNPTSLSIDASNNLYVGDYNGIRKVSPLGAVSTFASSSLLLSAGCNNALFGLSVDSYGTVYASSLSKICRVSSSGVASFVAGSGVLDVVDGVGAAASLLNLGLVLNATGTQLYLADVYAVRTLNIASAAVTILAGKSAANGYVDGAAASARYRSPRGIAADTAGYLYVADKLNRVVRKITPGGVVSTLAGLAGSAGSTDGSGAAARFDLVEAVTTDSTGNVYVIDGYAVRKITPAGVVSTLAGNVSTSGFVDGSGSAARFRTAYGLTTDAAGNVYVADSGNNVIRKITPAGVVTTWAGSVLGSSGSLDGSGTAARFNAPVNICADAAGNLYVSDLLNSSIRKITPAGMVSTLAGSAGVSGYVDGNGSSARFWQPSVLTIDTAGNLYVADWRYGVVRKITPAGNVSTVVGQSTGMWRVITGNLPGGLSTPSGMAIIGKKLYITDENGIFVADVP